MLQYEQGDRNEEDKTDDPLELGKVEDKKRKFLNQLRPHERIWNFI